MEHVAYSAVLEDTQYAIETAISLSSWECAQLRIGLDQGFNCELLAYRISWSMI